MNMIMDWGKCKREFIRKVDIDEERICSIIEKARQRQKRADSTEPSKANISFIVEDYYEVIKELLIAYLLKKGMRSKNHQCLISFFYKENPDYEAEAHLIGQMSFFRNRLAYYGESVPLVFYEKNKKEFKRAIDIILKLIQEG